MGTRYRSDSLDSSHEMAYTSSTDQPSRLNADYAQVPQEAAFVTSAAPPSPPKDTKSYPRPMEVEEPRSFAYDSGSESLIHKESGRLQVSSITDVLSILRWWQPELFASALTLAAFIALIAVINHYDGVAVQDLKFPTSLTLNGLIALLSTFIRASLMVPIGSALSQEAWIWLSENRYHQSRHGQLRDLEFSDAASRGAWGSFLSLFRTRRRYTLGFQWRGPD